MITTTPAQLPHRFALLALALLPFSPAPIPPDSVLRVITGTTDAGDATPQWLAMLRKRLSPAEYDSVSRIRKRRTADEEAWAVLIQSRAASWEREIPALTNPFDPLPAPSRVVIVLGNRGGGDAFTHDPTTIGFDLGELAGNYGSAALPQNMALMDRLFRHEFTHLLQKAWLPTHPWNASSPIRAALLDIWQEGLGNYYSLSERWRNQNGQRPEAAQRALADLEPRFVARLAALACVEPDNAAPLLAGISAGSFDRKWGAIPAAVWLDEDQAASATALRNLVAAGPAGIWELAHRHLSEPLRRVLAEARVADSLCTQSDQVVANTRLPAGAAALASETVAGAIANSLLLDLRGSGDHRGPVVFAVPADPIVAAWTRQVAALIRRDGPDLIADSAGRLSLRFQLRQLDVSDQSITVQGSFSRCQGGSEALNFWEHEVEIVIPRRGDSWEPSHSRITMIADGRC